jgi:hypothetical protein
MKGGGGQGAGEGGTEVTGARGAATAGVSVEGEATARPGATSGRSALTWRATRDRADRLLSTRSGEVQAARSRGGRAMRVLVWPRGRDMAGASDRVGGIVRAIGQARGIVGGKIGGCAATSRGLGASYAAGAGPGEKSTGRVTIGVAHCALREHSISYRGAQNTGKKEAEHDPEQPRPARRRCCL